ncbi:MAG: exosortase/archaeosortase family protein [Candidatus Acidiferrales bacterium]
MKEQIVGDGRAHAAFAGLVILSILVFWKALHELVVFSLNQESSSHILLIPLVSVYLLYSERSRIFRFVHSSLYFGGAVVLAAVAIYVIAAGWLASWRPDEFLSVATLAIVSIWLGGFLLCYGSLAWRRASFSLLFLLLMVPLPPPILERSIYMLQQGSTEIAYLLFKAVGVPVLRQGFVLTVPGVAIEVAKECSGIRSSVALFITCLLAAHLFLRTKWRMLIFVLLVFPLAIVKNGIRITTLTLLSVYVDPGFLTGRLHHEGGFVFFFLALALLAPVLKVLQSSEQKTEFRDAAIARKTENELAPGS